MILWFLLNYFTSDYKKKKGGGGVGGLGGDSAIRLQFPPRFPVYVESHKAACCNGDPRLWKGEGMQIAYSDSEAQTHSLYWKLLCSVRSRELFLLSRFRKIHFERHPSWGETLFLLLLAKGSKIPLKDADFCICVAVSYHLSNFLKYVSQAFPQYQNKKEERILFYLGNLGAVHVAGLFLSCK